MSTGSATPGAPQEREENRWVALARQQPGLTALALMSLVGLGISIYLTVVHYNSHVALVCTAGGVVSCQDVTTSAWSVVPFTTIPVTIPGMLWFIALGGATVYGLRAVTLGQDEPAWLRSGMLAWTLLGMAFVVYLLFAEIVKVQKLCEWCTAVHLLTFASLLIALTRWQRRFDAPVAPASRARVAPRAPSTMSSTQPTAHSRPSVPAVPRRTRRALSQRNGGR